MKEKVQKSAKSEKKIKIKEKNKLKYLELLKKIFENIKLFCVKNKKKFVIAIIILIIITLSIFIIMIYNYIKYKPYEDKINMWGLNELYTNNKTSFYQKVTNIEMIKFVTGLSLNLSDISGIENQKEVNFKDENWVKVAELYNIIEKDKINKKNYKKSSTLKDIIITLAKAEEKIMNITFDSKKISLDSNISKKINKIDEKYINEMIVTGILDLKDININKKINKGQFNKIIVKFAEQTSAIFYDRSFKIETNINNMPKSYKKYPFIIKGIDKEIYDIPLMGSDAENFNTPITAYKTRKKIYEQTDLRIKEYYNTILNVDYNTIDSENLKNIIEKNSLYYNNPGHYINYTKYVKDNKIILKGNIETYLPIMYYDGSNYRVRTKITFEVLSSETDMNLLLPDWISDVNIQYLDKKYTAYADVVISQSYNSISQKILIMPIKGMLLSNTDKMIQK